MLEKDFQKEVIEFLKQHNIYYIKIWGGGFQRAGIPDIIICLKGKFLAIELKTETRKTNSPAITQHRTNKKIRRTSIYIKTIRI